MLTLEEISVRFGEKQVLDKCSLRIGKGERVALTGPSGCGKTTLARAALSLQNPDTGTVSCGFSRAAAVFQEPRLLPWLTATENVNLVLSDSNDTMEEARAWLDNLELGDSAGLYPSELSGGMQQRVSIARALAVRPELLVMDEPFKGMDAALRDRVLRVTADALGDAALLLITHNEREAYALGCRVLRYRDGCFV